VTACPFWDAKGGEEKEELFNFFCYFANFLYYSVINLLCYFAAICALLVTDMLICFIA